MNEIIKRTIENLEKNNMETHFLKAKEDVVPLIDSIIKPNSTVFIGGSVTLTETGVIEYLKTGKHKFYDRNNPNLTDEGVTDILVKTYGGDVFLCSSNAVTEEGELYNVDGRANRISAIAYGPKKVIIVVGTNKIVKNLDEAVKRVKTISAPLNCKRLDCRTYCFEKGHCMDMEGGMGKGCNSAARICRHYLVSSKQDQKGRITVIIVDEKLGY